MKKYLYFIIPTILVLLAVSFWLIARSQTTTIASKPASTNSTLDDYYHTAQELKDQSNQTTSTTFLAAGDISLSRNIAQTIKDSGNVDKPFSLVQDLLKSVDFTFANLETPFSNSDAFTPHNTLIFNAPKANVQALVDNNVKIVNLANNHASDQGLTGITTTKDWLDQHHIAHMGTGNTLDEAWTPAIIEQNRIKIGFIGASYASVNDGGKATNNYVARMEDVDSLKSKVQSLKSQVDFIVVTMHGGTEYTRTPNKLQSDFAYAAIEAGADIVIGAHPHWVQTIEKYNDKYIFYSLGNLVFDQSWSQETKEGLTLKITLEKNNTNSLQGSQTGAIIKQIELLPVIIENNSSPRLATADETKKILNKIGVTDTVLNP